MPKGLFGLFSQGMSSRNRLLLALLTGLVLGNLLWWPQVSVAQTQAEAIPLSMYREKVAAYHDVLTQADGAAQLAAVQQELAAIQQVELPSGAVLTLQPLLGDPAEAELDLTTAQARLATVLHELAATPNDDTAARLLLLTTIFQRPEFVARDSLWQRFWRWLRSWLPEIETSDQGAGADSALFQWVGWALIGVGALLLIWLLSYWLQTLLGSFVGGIERGTGQGEAALPPSAGAARSAPIGWPTPAATGKPCANSIFLLSYISTSKIG
ncbi:MAG: hypothetical protein R3E79_20490 [Caldilineaceae bacterium]